MIILNAIGSSVCATDESRNPSNAYATITGFGVMRTLKKQRASGCKFKDDIKGENPSKGGIKCHQ
jgi:hypothetical protein